MEKFGGQEDRRGYNSAEVGSAAALGEPAANLKNMRKFY